MAVRRLIILLHRYIGIPMSVVFVVWFVSGIVMIYTGGMPSLTSTDRLRGLGPIDFDSVNLTPADATGRAGIEGPVSDVSLGTLLGRPVYRLSRAIGPPAAVFADTGDVFADAPIEQGRQEVARFLQQPATAVEFSGVVSEVDQWTITIARQLPLDRYDVADGRGTRAYFSRQTGQVELVTDRGSRTLAWAGAIPHWFYFTPLRTNQPLWYWTVVWAAVVGCVMALLGIVLAFTQFRRSKPFRLSASIRYRGWMRWHYYTGALFGVFALTWAFSGMMSMEPFDWTNADGMRLPPNNLRGGALELDRYMQDMPAFVDEFGDDVAEVDLIRILGEPYMVVTSIPEASTLRRRLVQAETLEVRRDAFAPEPVLAEIERTVTDVNIVEQEVLDDYDGYYYSRGAPLPVLRVKFDDPAETWYYFDLMTYGTVAANHRPGRIERWLFQGLHSLDFGFWYHRRPLWDIGMILLSLGALATSGIGMYLGFRRLFRRPVRLTSER